MRRLAALAFLLVACSPYKVVRRDPAPTWPIAAPPPEAAQVCVLRPHYLAAAATLVTHDNGNLVGATRGPGWFCWIAQPGRHTIDTREGEPASLQEPRVEHVVLAAGARYWLRQIMTPVGFWEEWLDDAQAEPLLGKCHYEVVSAAPASDPPPTALPPRIAAE